MKIELETAEGSVFAAEITYGRMTDNIIVETALGTFTFKGPSVRHFVDQLLFLSTPPPPGASSGKKAA
jgi:hypothetical protein